MANIETGGGGRKANVELNLVPIIDLMSVLITFLLITAVWTQVSMLQIGSSVYGKRSDDKTVTLPPKASLVLKLDIVAKGYILTIGKKKYSLSKVDGQYDAKGLGEQLEALKRKHPAKVDAVLSMSDNLPYEYLIQGMDLLLQSGFPQIGVATGGPN